MMNFHYQFHLHLDRDDDLFPELHPRGLHAAKQRATRIKIIKAKQNKLLVSHRRACALQLSCARFYVLFVCYVVCFYCPLQTCVKMGFVRY